MRTFALTLFATLLSAGAIQQCHAQIIWDEGVNGDLSNNRLAPTNINLGFGVNGMIVTTSSSDVDYVHVHLGSGMSVTQLNLVSWSGVDQRGFMALQAGSTFTESTSNPNVANMLGYCHIGPAAGNLGKDLLPILASGAGAQGFTPPLAGSDYTFWLNQTSFNAETYRLDFVVVPEPSSLALVIGAVSLTVRRKRLASRNIER